jgi:hypothetical protein
VIPDFRGHHFLEDSKPNEPPSEHHCERCGMKALLRPDGSTDFEDGSGALVEINARIPLNTSPVRPSK